MGGGQSDGGHEEVHPDGFRDQLPRQEVHVVLGTSRRAGLIVLLLLVVDHLLVFVMTLLVRVHERRTCELRLGLGVRVTAASRIDVRDSAARVVGVTGAVARAITLAVFFLFVLLFVFLGFVFLGFVSPSRRPTARKAAGCRRVPTRTAAAAVFLFLPYLIAAARMLAVFMARRHRDQAVFDQGLHQVAGLLRRCRAAVAAERMTVPVVLGHELYSGMRSLSERVTNARMFLVALGRHP